MSGHERTELKNIPPPSNAFGNTDCMKLSELIEVIIDLFISLILIIYTTVYKTIKAHIELRLRAAKFAIIFLIVA